MAFTMLEVKSSALVREFLSLPVNLYRNDSNWIRPLGRDIEDVFNPAKNKHFRHGEATRWILLDDKGKTVGRVAAFIDHQTSKTHAQPSGGMGFFECIDSQDAANALFDTCKQWLQARGMEAMDGPINFGERDRWWGLLAEGFYEPNYCMGYHHKYYQKLFENYGFKVLFRQLTYHMPVTDKNVDPVVWEKANRIAQNPDYRVVNINRKELAKFADDFVTIYNKAWGRFTGVGKMSRAQANALLKSIKPIIDERLMLFAYHLDEPIGFLIMLPELNQVVKHLNGKFNLLAKLKMMYLLKVKKVCTKALGLIFGVVPQHQGKGIEGALVKGFAHWATRDDYPYTEIELNWIGDFNPAMCKVAEQIGAKVRKVHITYRYLFDPNRDFEPYRRIN